MDLKVDVNRRMVKGRNKIRDLYEVLSQNENLIDKISINEGKKVEIRLGIILLTFCDEFQSTITKLVIMLQCSYNAQCWMIIFIIYYF